MRWDDVIARAAGLTTHLLGREQLLRILAAGTWLAGVRAAVDIGVPVEGEALGSPARFDRAIGRVAGRRLALLHRWLGPRAPALAWYYEDLDRRDLRALLRGVAHGASPVARLGTVVATPTLSDPVLDRLARAGSTDELIAVLRRAGHPAARALAAVDRSATRDRRTPVGLVALELALSQAFAKRAARLARRAGRLIRASVATAIDLENIWSLLTAADWEADLDPEVVFLPGGRALDAGGFRSIAALDGDRIRERVATVMAPGPLGSAFADRSVPIATLESRAAAAREAWFRSEGRRDPLGPGRLLAALERIGAEAHDLRLVLGGLALGAAADTIEPLLVTAG